MVLKSILLALQAGFVRPLLWIRSIPFPHSCSCMLLLANMACSPGRPCTNNEALGTILDACALFGISRNEALRHFYDVGEPDSP